jgi:hypothetical protein
LLQLLFQLLLLNRLYQAIGEQEKAIRTDPVGTGSKLLSKVFGAALGR